MLKPFIAGSTYPDPFQVPHTVRSRNGLALFSSNSLPSYSWITQGRVQRFASNHLRQVGVSVRFMAY